MRTFWIYFLIFLCLSLLTQAFLYLFGSDQYSLDFLHGFGQIVIITLIALIASYILRKKKNEYKEKAN